MGGFGLVGGLFGGGGGDSGVIKGTGYYTKDIAEKDITPTAGAIKQISLPELQQYIAWLNQLTSSDPNQRFAAVAPQVGDITAQSEAAKQQIRNLPRGGEQNYLLAGADISKSSDIGRLLTDLYTKAQAQKGAIGEEGLNTALQYFNTAIGGEQAAAGILSGNRQLDAQGSQATMQAVMQLAMMAAAA